VRGPVEPHIICGRDGVGPAEIFREPFGAFELRGCCTGTEDRDASFAQRVGHAGDQWRLRADDDEVDPFVLRQLNDSGRIAGVNGDAFRPAGDARISWRRQQLVTARRLPKAPGKRILTAARAQKQNIHGSS